MRSVPLWRRGRTLHDRSSICSQHGVPENDAIEAARWAVRKIPLDDENPGRQLRLGFDTSGRLLELIVLVWDDGTEELIHAMKARPQYIRLLE